MKRNSVELLAPAGNMAAFYAAIEHGADAVYLGGKKFSARASAQNFTLEEMAQAVSYAHVRGKKVYVTLNILLSDAECKEAVAYAEDLLNIGIDGLILQDLGFSELLGAALPGLERHGSTQMSVLDRKGAEYLEAMGFTRVVVAREIALEEIKNIDTHTDLEIEAFCHGALCVSVSGQCEMSSYIGARSGNRGNCAQPCRKRYTIEDGRGGTVLERGYLLSPRDLLTIDFVEALAESGVDSFKLEGRMKSPLYVAGITENYDRALRCEDYSKEAMAQLFNRSYTRGVGFGDFSEDFITTSRPNHRGVIIGEVQGGRIRWRKRPDAGDLLEYCLAGKRTRHTVTEVEAAGGKLKTLPDDGAISRLRSVRLESTLETEAEDVQNAVPLAGRFYAHIGERPRFELIGKKRVEAVGDAPLERARSAKLDGERIRGNLAKFDKSAFYLDRVELDVDRDVFLPISLVNALRREAIDRYERSEKKAKHKPVQPTFTRLELKKTLLTVELADEADIYDLPYELIDRLELYFQPTDEAKAFLKEQDLPIYASLPYEGAASEDDFYSGTVVQNLGQIKEARGHVVIGEGLNVFNSLSFEHFLAHGSVMPSFECKREQLEGFFKNFASCGEVLYYGYPRSMVMRHCPMSLIKKCGADRNCRRCAYQRGYALRDEKGARFPFRRVGDMTEIYNSLPIYLGDRSKQLMALRPEALKIRSRLGEDIRPVIEEARRVIEGDVVTEPVVPSFTRGHFNRGII